MSNSEAPSSGSAVIAPPAKVALVGLGNMGRPMAARLIGAGEPGTETAPITIPA